MKPCIIKLASNDTSKMTTSISNKVKPRRRLIEDNITHISDLPHSQQGEIKVIQQTLIPIDAHTGAMQRGFVDSALVLLIKHIAAIFKWLGFPFNEQLAQLDFAGRLGDGIYTRHKFDGAFYR